MGLSVTVNCNGRNRLCYLYIALVCHAVVVQTYRYKGRLNADVESSSLTIDGRESKFSSRHSLRETIDCVT
jgi:hypothetical protein